MNRRNFIAGVFATPLATMPAAAISQHLTAVANSPRLATGKLRVVLRAENLISFEHINALLKKIDAAMMGEAITS